MNKSNNVTSYEIIRISKMMQTHKNSYEYITFAKSYTIIQTCKVMQKHMKSYKYIKS